MTRINVVPENDLCDAHLQAEWREMTRIPNKIASGKYVNMANRPAEYTVQTALNAKGGRGHELFFTNKLQYLRERYLRIIKEAQWRGLNLTDQWPSDVTADTHPKLWNDYVPTRAAVALNVRRLIERTPEKPKLNKIPFKRDTYIQLFRMTLAMYKLSNEDVT